MGKKLNKFPFLSRPTDAAAAVAAWPWPAACITTPRTLSFRDADSSSKTIVSQPTADSYSKSFSTLSETGGNDTAVIGGLTGLRSDRLFFEPGETNSILEVAKPHAVAALGGGVAILALESRDPFLDFRSSMAEMVEAQGLKDWGRLEELLTCYLRVNSKSNHRYIVGAFIDLLMNLALASAIDEHCSGSSSSSCSTALKDSFTSHVSFSSAYTDDSSNGHRCLDNEDDEAVKIANTSSSSAA